MKSDDGGPAPFSWLGVIVSGLVIVGALVFFARLMTL